MPIRMLRDWTDSEKVNGLNVHAERFFVRLIMVVDDFGCYYANTSLLKAKCFPLLLDQVREADISRWMDECHQAGLIVLYENAGKKYLQILDFNQRMDKARAKYPLPDGRDASVSGYVYFMGVEGLNIFKIGHSLNPWARLKEVARSKDATDLLSERSKDLSLRFTFKGTTENEKMFHQLLRIYNVKNEWFKLSDTLINLFTEQYNTNLTAGSVIDNYSSQTVGNYVPAETETERNTKPNRAKALVIASNDDSAGSALKKEYQELLKQLEGKDRLTIWNSVKDFIRDKKPLFIEPYFDAWNVFAMNIRLIKEPQKITDNRRKKFNTRIMEADFDFLKILEKIQLSKFLKGDNDRGWKVSIEFILESQEKYTKILEGKYDHL